MMDFVTHIFGWVCGQSLEHTWSPGGLPLPCCQRCTGLYVGAGIAAGLHFWLKPKLSGRFLEIHGAFLLLMVPFGFHWLAQGPWLRTATGVLFGFGVVTCLWLVAGARLLSPPTTGKSVIQQAWKPALRGGPPCAAAAYWVGLIVTTAVVPAAAQFGNARAAMALSSLALGGFLVLAALALANAGCGLLGGARTLRRWLTRAYA